MSDNGLTSLPAGVFSGLSSLTGLWLHNNALTSLPAGVFSGLSSLTVLELSGNTVTSFDVALSLEVDSANSTVRILAPLGAPEALAIPISFSGGTVSGSSTATVTIPTGATASPTVTVDFADDEEVVTVSFGTLPALTPYSGSPPYSGIAGLRLVAGDTASLSMGICGRTEQVQTAIRAALANRACSLFTAADLARISGTLDLSSQGIASLQASDFSGLSGLTGLALYSNALTSLPKGVFGGLSSLTDLNLSGNGLASLRSSDFSGLSSLTELSLGGNGLGSLPKGVFSGLSSLTGLWLDGTSLTSLQSEDFSGLSSLTNLQLQNNGLTSLPAGVFSGLSNLSALRLEDNALMSLPAGVFSGLSSLQDLWLNSNALTSLPAGVFSGLSNLTILRLSGNDNAPFDVALSLESDLANSTVRVLAPLGAPEALAIPLSISGGTVSGSTTPTVTIPAGETASPAVTVDAEAVVTVSFGALPVLTPYSLSTGGIDGLNLVAGSAVSFAPGICGRTGRCWQPSGQRYATRRATSSPIRIWRPSAVRLT